MNKKVISYNPSNGSVLGEMSAMASAMRMDDVALKARKATTLWRIEWNARRH